MMAPSLMGTSKVTKVKLLQKAKHHAENSYSKLESLFPHATKHLESLGLDLRDIRRHSAKMLSAAAIAAGLVIATPVIQTAVQNRANETRQKESPEEISHKIHENLTGVLPSTPRPLTSDQEDQINRIFRSALGVNAVAHLDGNHLNTTYGIMGGEQHMPRYPGDTLGAHDELQVKGITAHRGAFGYFAPNKEAMTPEIELQEKYYIAVQTLYLPNWNQNYAKLKDWYKFRKVLVVNPTTGKSVVAVVGDAGPAAWTGKQFGGSPEVMDYLEIYTHNNKGKVLVFFIDDLDNRVALGPVTSQQNMYIAMQ